jgi:uncharacterized membrane protein
MRPGPIEKILFIPLMLAGAACVEKPIPPAAASMDELRNATYHDVVPAPVTLVDGRVNGDAATSQYAPRLTVTLADGIYARGDLTGDGRDEAVALLAANFGGSGVFESFVIVAKKDGLLEHLASISLGDRARVTDVSVDDGILVADLIVHGPDDPMCCPTQATRREWRLENGQLTEIASDRAPMHERFRGHLVWGHESRSFTVCGEGRSGWVVNEVGDELVSIYDKLASEPYQPIFVEVRGVWGPAPEGGFGANYAENLTITSLLRAEGEGFGCRLDLDGLLYIANGNEPSWRLEIRDAGMTLRTMASPDGAEFGPPRQTGDAGITVFEADGTQGAIRVALERRRCADPMSGALYEFSATAEIGESRFQGCALQGL